MENESDYQTCNNKEVPQKWQLKHDPILEVYLKLASTSKTQRFSETMLRLAFKDFFGTSRAYTQTELQLYRQLILLHYHAECDNFDQLLEIMTCFERSSAEEAIENQYDIKIEWMEYAMRYFYAPLYKRAMFELLLEYAKRHVCVHKVYLSEQQLLNITIAIQRFFGVDTVRVQRYSYYRTILPLLENKLSQIPRESAELLTEDDLRLPNIYNDIQDRVNGLIVSHSLVQPKVKLAPKEYKVKKPRKMPQKRPRKGKQTKQQTRSQLWQEEQEAEVVNEAEAEGEGELETEIEIELDEENDNICRVIWKAELKQEEQQQKQQQQQQSSDEEMLDNDSQQLVENVKQETSGEELQLMQVQNVESDTELVQLEIETVNIRNRPNAVPAKRRRCITQKTALNYCSALTAYVVENGKVDCLRLLDMLESKISERF